MKKFDVQIDQLEVWAEKAAEISWRLQEPNRC